MNDTQLQRLQKISDLQTAFTDLYILDGDTFKPRVTRGKNIYDSAYKTRLEEFSKGLNTIGIDPKLTPKQIELNLQQKYEELYKLLKQTPKFKDADRPNDMPTKTTWNKDESAQFQEEARIRNEQIAATRENQTKLVEDFIKQNEERITKARSLQDKLKDKVVYAKVVIPEEEKLTQDEQQKLETLKKYANNETVLKENSLTPKQILINDLSTKIEEILEPDLKNLTPEEKLIIAQTYAVKLVEEISKPADDYSIPIQTAILTALPKEIDSGSKIIQRTIPDDPLIQQAKEGSIALELENRNNQFITKEISRRIFGEKVTSRVFGVNPEQIVVTFTDKIEASHTTYTVNFGALNKEYEQVLDRQNRFIGEVRSIGVENIQSLFINEGRTILRDKITKSAVGKFVSKDPVLNAIFAQNVLGDRVVWQVVNQNRLAQVAVKLSPEIAGPVLGFFGKATPIITATTSKVVAGKIATQVAVKKGFGAVIGKVIGFFAGTPAGPAGWIAGLAIGEVAGRAIQNIWSRVKIWIKENKDIAAPAVGVGTAFFIAPFFGAGPAVLGGVGTFALFGGSVGGLVLSGARLFGLIGRSVGIAIATPVIVTLLVLPPLVAFIMLVINNSAYVVPPSPYSSSLNGGADNPYMLVTKTANPTKLDNSRSNQTVIYVVTVKALKGNLTNVNITDSKCTVIKKDKSKVQCPTEVFPEIENDSISPNEPHTFSFTGIYDSRYSDSLISDSITFTATAEDGTEVTTSGSASVCIGECPANCAVVSDNADNWSTTKLAQNVNIAIGMLSQYQGFTAKLCPNNEPINLCYRPSEINPGNYAWHVSNKYGDNCDIYFNSKGIGSEKDALFMITHELTHHVQAISSEHELSYSVSGAWIPEIVSKGLCTYSATNGVSLEAMREGMAEAAALYTNSSPSWDTCASNYSSKYPRNYNWAKKFMEE